MTPPRDYPERYRSLPPVTARNSGRSFWHAFMRGLGYGLARVFWKGIRK